MQVKDFLPQYPSIKDDNFQYKIAQKKEFYDLQLDEYETEPSVDGKYYKHQVIIERFLSNETPYDGLLVCFGTGIGKTKTSILASERNLKSSAKFKRTLFLAKNKLLIDNFKKELASFDPIYNEKKNIKKYYEFNTVDKFSKKISKMSDNEVISSYSNRVIIIDEAHNLRIKPLKKDKPDTKLIYNNIHRFLHTAKNSKTLLLTATPIWDQVDEIASLMNLILPMNEQINYKNFEKDFFDDDGNLLNKDTLSKKFGGRVAFVRQMQSDVYKEYQGEIKNPLKKLNIVYDEMSGFQHEVLKGVSHAISKKAEGLRVEELEASSFVFPDKTYGDKGVEKNCDISKDGKKYSLKNSIKEEIKNNLKKYSSKINNVVKEILDNPTQNVFVYHPRVKSGTFLIGMILELFGFSKTMGGDIFSTKKKRYAIISSEAATSAEAIQIMKSFNDPRNKNGDYIQVLIGSKQISEGISLKNVQQMHIIVPPWNISGMDQIVGRVVRLKSHKDFNDPKAIKVKIFLHASSYKNLPTTDIEVYEIAEVKDFKTKQIIRLLKENAFDCPLTHKRNVNKGDQPHSRDCDYQDCNYECLTFHPPSKNYAILEGEIDPTNYNLFYSEKEILEIKKYIENLFKFYNSLDIELVKNFIKDKSASAILKALENIMNKKIIILDKYGFPSILRENKNIYYLQSASNLNDEKLLKKDNGIILTEKTPLKEILDIMKIQDSKDTVKELCSLKNKDKIIKTFEKLDQHIKIIIFETCFGIVSTSHLNDDHHLGVPSIIVEHMNSFFYKIKNTNIIKDTFDEMENAINVGKHVVTFMKTLVDVFSDIYPEGVERASQIEKNYVEKNHSKVKSLIKELKTESLEKLKDTYSNIHTLYHFEKYSTNYKRELTPNGELRMYSTTLRKWVIPRVTLEKKFIARIKNINVKNIKEVNKENAYGVSGAIDQNAKDPKKKFKLMDKSSKKGFVCKSTSDKNRLIKVAMEMREKERELGGEITLEPERKAYKGESSKELKEKIKVNFDIEKYSKEDLIALYEISMLNVAKVCDMLQGWLEEKGLLREI